MSKSKQSRRELKRKRLALDSKLNASQPPQTSPKTKPPNNTECQECSHIPIAGALGIPGIDPNPPNPNRASEQENAPCPRTEKFFKKWKNTIEAMGVLAAIAVLIVYACQLGEMIKGNNATAKAIEINQGQMNISRSQFEDGESVQRARIAVPAMRFKIIPKYAGVPINMVVLEVQITATNFGPTVADDVAVHGACVDDVEAKEREKTNSGVDPISTNFLYHGGIRNPQPEPGGIHIIPAQIQELEPADFKIIPGHDQRMNLWIDFNDIFGHARNGWAAFGLYSYSNNTFRVMGFYPEHQGQTN